MDYTNRFSGKGEIYAKARPKYAAGLFDYLQNTMGVPAGSVFADVGAGTGIFAGQLLDCGYSVFAVEPNADMRKKAEEKLSASRNFVSVIGSDGNMNLPDKSVDYVTAAQAFHWFDAEAFRRECRRVLKPGGKVILVYNARDMKADGIKALANLHSRYNPEFHGFSNGMSHEKCMNFFAGTCDVFRTDNTQVYGCQDYVNFVLSSSYSLKADDTRYAKYLKDISEIFGTFSADGFIAVPTETVAYIGTV